MAQQWRVREPGRGKPFASRGDSSVPSGRMEPKNPVAQELENRSGQTGQARHYRLGQTRGVRLTRGDLAGRVQTSQPQLGQSVLVGPERAPFQPSARGRFSAQLRVDGDTRHTASRLRQWAESASISDSIRHAIGLGTRSSCSHDRTVEGSTPRNAAKAAWLMASSSRTRRTPSPSYCGGGAILYLRTVNRDSNGLPACNVAARSRNPSTMSSPFVRAVVLVPWSVRLVIELLPSIAR